MGVFINQIKTYLLLAVLTGIMLLIGSFFGKAGFTVAIIFVLFMNFLTYFFSDKIVLWMYRAKEIKQKDNPKLFSMIKDVTTLAGIPMPKVYIIPSDSPNAFATGRNPKNAAVAVTKGIMDLLTERELKGVIAHEVSHVKNRDILIGTIAATIAGIISYLAHWGVLLGFGGDDDNNNFLALILIAILAPIIAIIIQLAISRSREYLADETGAKTIHDPKALADALEKLDKGIAKNPLKFGNNTTSSLFIANPFNVKGVFALFSTHPPLDQRIKKLRAMKV